jgi:hypothetical protein
MTNGKLLACAFAAVGLVSIPRQARAIDRLKRVGRQYEPHA